MPVRTSVTEILVCGLLAAVLAGCGDSTPLPPAPTPGSSATVSGVAYMPGSGAFAPMDASALQGVATTASCNLDAINNQPVGSAPLTRASSALFAGWAADAEDKAVPPRVRLILRDAQHAYAVTVATGMPRPDVAQANRLPQLTSAGYAVNASLASVPPGTYTVALEFKVAGKHLQCVTPHQTVIQ